MWVTHIDFTDANASLLTIVCCNNQDEPVEIALWQYATRHSPEDPKINAE